MSMSRIRIELPKEFSFSTIIPIRITDLNYGNHVGNDAILSLIHEARVQFLKHHGYTELSFEGTSLIMSDAGIEFKAELFYGDTLKAYVAVADVTRAAFNLYYKLVKDDTENIVAVAKTGIVCFDYNTRKVTAVPEAAKIKLAIDNSQ